jgi:DNA modification methylase
MKPVALPARAISNSSAIGDVVYEPFAGGGSTMVAAEQMGRLCYGVEIDPKYVAVCLERMSDMGLRPQLVQESCAIAVPA